MISSARRWLNGIGPLLGLVAILIFFVPLIYSKGELSTWLSARNLKNLLHQYCVHGVIALGMLMIIVSGGIDLSVGSVVSLVTVVSMQVYRSVESPGGSTFLPSVAAMGAGIAIGVVCGAINGFIITRLKVAPFIVTLGMMSIARGAAIWLSGRTTVSFSGERPGWVDSLAEAQNSPVFFDPGVWSWAVLSVLAALVLRSTVFGRYVYAIGSNEATARLCGIHVERYRLRIYALAGLLTGWAGVMRFAHINSGDPNSGQLLELEVIAAVVIGGAALAGGTGTVSGTVLGVLIVAVIDNSVNFLGVPIEVKYILIGAVVILNTALSQWQRARSR